MSLFDDLPMVAAPAGPYRYVRSDPADRVQKVLHVDRTYVPDAPPVDDETVYHCGGIALPSVEQKIAEMEAKTQCELTDDVRGEIRRLAEKVVAGMKLRSTVVVQVSGCAKAEAARILGLTQFARQVSQELGLAVPNEAVHPRAA